MSQVDLLDEDRPIAEQKFVCLSFVSPEYLIKKKDEYFFEQFVSQYDTSKSMEKFVEFLNYISYKYAISSEEIMQEYSSFPQNYVRAMWFQFWTTCDSSALMTVM